MVEKIFISLLNFFYSFSHDFGISLILFAFLIYLLFLPLTFFQLKSQKRLDGFQKKLKEIQEKYKNDKKAQTEAIAQFLKEKNFRPFSFLLIFFIQLPILIIIYQIILKQVTHPVFPPFFLNTFDLTKPHFLFPLLIFLIQIFQTSQANFFQYFMVFFVFLILLKLPAGLNLYLLTFTFLSFLTQKVFFRKLTNKEKFPNQ